MKKSKCSAAACTRPAKAKTLCKAHYQQVWRGKSKPNTLRKYITGTMEERLMAHSIQTETCWIWTGTTTNGYGYVYDPKIKRIRVASRVSYETFKGKLDPRMQVHHACSNPSCINPDHLQAVEPYQNNAEMFERQYYINRIATLEQQIAECGCGKEDHDG
jgi:hypothetical protein